MDKDTIENFLNNSTISSVDLEPSKIYNSTSECKEVDTRDNHDEYNPDVIGTLLQQEVTMKNLTQVFHKLMMIFSFF